MSFFLHVFHLPLFVYAAFFLFFPDWPSLTLLCFLSSFRWFFLPVTCAVDLAVQGCKYHRRIHHSRPSRPSACPSSHTKCWCKPFSRWGVCCMNGALLIFIISSFLIHFFVPNREKQSNYVFLKKKMTKTADLKLLTVKNTNWVLNLSSLCKKRKKKLYQIV